MERYRRRTGRTEPQTETAVVQAEAPAMKTIPVVSNTLRTVGYDTDRQLLQIEFQNRSIYQYFEVPQAVYEELMQASSKGAYFNRSIRPHFDDVLVKAASLS
jgi:hypothetical protein